MEKERSSEPRTGGIYIIFNFEFEDERAFAIQWVDGTHKLPDTMKTVNTHWDFLNFSHRHEDNRTFPIFGFGAYCEPDQIETTRDYAIITMQNLLDEYGVGDIEIARAEHHYIILGSGNDSVLEDITIESRAVANSYKSRV